MIQKIVLTCLCLGLSVGVEAAVSPGSAMSYQGQLKQGGNPANGIYDLTFQVFTSPTLNTPATAVATNLSVTVSNGLFTTLVDFGGGPTEREDLWMQLGVRTNGATFFVLLSPRQPITSTPFAWYADYAATAMSASNVAPGVITGAGLASGTITAGKIATGQVVKSLNGFTDAVVLSAGTNVILSSTTNGVRISATPGSGTNTGWGLAGNSGTSPANFLGTTDPQPLEVRVNNSRVLRLELNGTAGAPNVVGGGPYNLTLSGVVGATIGGGGATNYGGAALTNRIEANFGTIAGGGGNRIQSLASESTIGGGVLHTIATNAHESFIGGGYRNTVMSNAYSSTISGGADNLIGSGAFRATLAGGYINTNRGAESVIGGGYRNLIQATGTDAVIAGGIFNTVTGPYGIIAGGRNNHVASSGGMVLGGEFNNVSGSNSFAAGTSAQASHDGTFVWSDHSGSQTWSTGPNQFIVRAKGGVGINNNAPQSDLSVAGGMNVDQNSRNNGTFTNLLTFGSYSGEGIGSQRTGEGNQFGLDFYTAYEPRLSISQWGTVGVGTRTPGSAFEVIGESRSSGLTLTGDYPTNQLTFGVGSGEGIGSPRSGDYRFGLDFYTGYEPRMTIVQWGYVGIGTRTPQTMLDVAGETRTQVLTITGGADVAEPFETSSGAISAGSVLVIDAQNPGRLKLSEQAYDTRVAGIVSGANGIQPGLTLRQEGTVEGARQVALSGRVYVRADASTGAIKPGDLLTSGTKPGHAMKAADPVRRQGAILGKAMTGLKEGQGFVLVLVSLQ